MIVIIDNYDSFTYNLVQYFKQLTSDVLVFRNDDTSVEQITELEPDLIVLSPGPGDPTESGICPEVVDYFYRDTPILGVCLGFQVIVDYFGGKVEKGKSPMHGKVTLMDHDQQGVFKELSSPSKITRYHSLVASPAHIPSQLKVSATAADSAIMGVRHVDFPIEAIQFHPESILTENGFTMIKNSYELAIKWKHDRGEKSGATLSSL
ncbi:aminodeoxychorismate/anthranilate synthase component II [Aquibacillus koreensis]|uniref:Aminodeoxychorismate/anthranilate synthase component II n=1 Tax=Aquibacillus koreensis TaxID=279446 RepID=A0A9X3WN67_9BACI|nr:aminodeoxychorismate/anthranilate synthase component II [Aquibacillus koreensis]MCT2535965.1 aminodeoxychorismate/anthranilate synthase component II [Aquibacillus koreensis]MDC3420421.1 aminodeoxychorismate/anthranilate synthase component II [Aquibacillus koreensis]